MATTHEPPASRAVKGNAPWRGWCRTLRRQMNRIRYRGTARHCSVCDRDARLFLPGGLLRRPDAVCPHCGAFERHRLLMSFLRLRTTLFDGAARRMLHVAPEPAFIPVFQGAVGSGYLTADLFAAGVMEVMDITDIRHPDGSFDVIYCGHVLEHVLDDRRAMREFHRVLADDGWAVLNVPIEAETTFEDPAVTEPEDRLRVFGQSDHVRIYGRDYPDRLAEAGFQVQVTTADDLFCPEEIRRRGLGDSAVGEIYFCTKP